MVRDEFLGVKAPSKTLLSVFAEFNDRQENLIGVDITQSTFNKFDLTFRRLEEFLRVKRNRPDIPVSLVDRDFVLDIPLSILKKYEPTRINGYLLPVLSNAKYNLYLKEIATALGIQKRVTSHLARHTFATTVTYAN